MCAKESCFRKLRKTTEEFIKEAKTIHGDKFDYSKTEYTGRRHELTITCPIHGDQKTTAENHLKGLGCPECSHKAAGDKKRFTKEKFVEEARKIHGDRYDYSKSNYVSMKTKLTITCPIHGDFLQKPHDHIKNRTGCPKCNSSKMEIDIRQRLIENNIIFEEQKSWDWLIFIDKQYVDFYLPEYNIVVECQGEQHFQETVFFGSLEARLARDKNKLNLCSEHNIKILYYSNLGENYQYPYKVFTNIDSLINEIKGTGMTSQP